MRYLFTVIIILSTITLFYTGLESSALPRRKPEAVASTGKNSIQRTRLRADMPVVLQRNSRTVREVRYANVLVRNIGAVEASGIQVLLAQSGGISFVMRGPKKLAPKESSLYVLNSRAVAGAGSWSVVARCANCWR
jgi:hypothetical protein